MVISVGGEPAHFTLDPSLGEFVLTSPKLAVPNAGKIYSVNEGNASLWDAAVAKCVRPAERRPCLFCALVVSHRPWHFAQVRHRVQAPPRRRQAKECALCG